MTAKECAASDLPLFAWGESRTPGVVEECRARHDGGGCIKIYAADMVTVERVETCRAWCPLLKQKIEDINDFSG